MSMIQCYCQQTLQDVRGMLKCDQCSHYFHTGCVKSGIPSRLAGDVFFTFTCENCSGSGLELIERMKKLSWLPVVLVSLYNLQLSSTGKLGYYRWKEHICAFIESHWIDFFGPNRQKTQTWFGTVAGILSSWCPMYFTSGTAELKQSGWWKLTDNSPPSLDILNARIIKKQKPNERSPDGNVEQKLEGLRNRVRKSTIEAAVELRAKRDIPTSSGRKRKNCDSRAEPSSRYRAKHVSSYDDDDDDVGSELTDNNSLSSSSFTVYDCLDQSSQMSRSSCRSDWLTEKDLVVGDTLPEYLLKEDEGDEDSTDELDIDPCRLSPSQQLLPLMHSAQPDDNLPNINDILSTLESSSYSGNKSGSNCSPLTVDKLNLHTWRQHEQDIARGQRSILKASFDSSSSDGESCEPPSTSYRSKAEENGFCASAEPDIPAKISKRKRLCKKEEPLAHQYHEQTETVVKMSLYEEKQLLMKLKQKVYADAIASSPDPQLRRFYRKLVVRQQQRERNLPVFDVDVFTQRLAEGCETLYEADQSNDLFIEVKTKVNDSGDFRVLDRYQNTHYKKKQVQSLSFLSRLIGSQDDQLSVIHSPYTKRVLKPFIRRDFESRPLKLRLLEEIISYPHRNDPDWKPEPLPSIDYCYVRPEHIPAVNALCKEYFWPGIDMSECLEYPDFSAVVLYRKLVIGFAFMVPNVKHNESYISFLFTHPEWRRAGIATFLLYHLIQTFTGTEVTLHVSASNPAMLLYQKFGFKPEQFVVNFYDKYFPVESTECRHAFFLRFTPPR